MTTSIGRRWKCSDACSRAVLIVRKLARKAPPGPLYIYTFTLRIFWDHSGSVPTMSYIKTLKTWVAMATGFTPSHPEQGS